MERIKLTLLDNGLHSINKGLETLTKYESQDLKDKYLLKESIMFLHHGVELLLKEVLVSKFGESFIFAKMDSATVKKVIYAKKEGKSVFDIEKPPHTATYIDAIERIKAFVDDVDLSERLETYLIQLNAIRNNIEHYGIDAEAKKIEILLFNLKEPITDFFKACNIYIGRNNEGLWRQLDRISLIQMSRLRGATFIKRAERNDEDVIIEYVKNFQEYQQLKPESKIDERQYEVYWESGDAIKKAIIDASVRLFVDLREIKSVRIKLPFKDILYEILVNKDELEKFLGHTIDELVYYWDTAFLNKFVYSKAGRNEFFERFKVNE